uniref:Uncharacterized protein n=1 Tax=Panagrolaimus sp. ES5 TaxID=591445 RepID=A0AC34FTB1_9BILA
MSLVRPKLRILAEEAIYGEKTNSNEGVTFFTFNRRELLPQSLCDGFSKYNFTDLPEHWKYLENFLLLNKFPFGHDPTEIVIVEKYKSLAIGYNYNLAKRPVVLYRHCYKYFKNIKVGDLLMVKLGKMYINCYKTTIIFTDLYCLVTNYIHQQSGYETISNGETVEIKNLLFPIGDIKRINQFDVIYADFGAVIIPSELAKVLCIFPDSFVCCTVRYCIHGLSHTHFACWKLDCTFDIYKNKILFMKCINGNFIRESEKRKRIAFFNGRQTCRMVEMKYIEEEKEVHELVQMKKDLPFINLDAFIKLNPEKKRRMLR